MHTDNLSIQNDLVALEFSEATYWKKYYEDSTPLNSYMSIIGGGFAGAIPDLDILALNRVIGLGVVQPITEKLLDNIIYFYQKAGSKRFFIQLVPQILDTMTVDLLKSKGFIHHNNWSKLVHDLNSVPHYNSSELRVRELSGKDSRLFGKIIYQSFDWEDEKMIDWLACTVGKEGYKHYAVYKEDVPVSVGAIHFMGKYASMAFAGTLPEYRGQGSQSLLLTKRLALAKEQKCRLAISETGQPMPDKPVKSFENMIKAGFKLVYQRQNWLYQF